MIVFINIFELAFTVPVKNKTLFKNVMKEVSYAHQECIYLIKNTVKPEIFQNIITN